MWLTKWARVTYCSVVQKHFFKSQKICKCEQHVKYVTSHFIFMVPAKEKDGRFMNDWNRFCLFKIPLEGFEGLPSVNLTTQSSQPLGSCNEGKKGCFSEWRRGKGEKDKNAESSSTHCKVVVKAAMLNPGIRSSSCSSIYFSTREICHGGKDLGFRKTRLLFRKPGL